MLSGERGGVFVTGCPDEVCGGGRTWDGEGLVHTIDDARETICISVMDFGPIGLYSRQKAGPPMGDHGGIPDNDLVLEGPEEAFGHAVGFGLADEGVSIRIQLRPPFRVQK